MGVVPEHPPGFRQAFHTPFPLVLATALCALVIAGCGKKDKIVDPGTAGTPKYAVPSSPLTVMTNLKTAYTAKDSAAYKACFDPNYLGTSQDQRTQSPIDTLTFAREAQHIAALARSTTVVVDLQLKPSMTRSADPGDPPGWALILNPIHSLEIYDGQNVYYVSVDNETMEFRFIPKTPDSSSPTDTTWKIIKWTEIAF